MRGRGKRRYQMDSRLKENTVLKIFTGKKGKKTVRDLRYLRRSKEVKGGGPYW